MSPLTRIKRCGIIRSLRDKENVMERKLVVDVNPFGFGEKNQYHYNAQIWTFICGKWWYAGFGKYCETIEDVLQYAKEQDLLIEFC